MVVDFLILPEKFREFDYHVRKDCHSLRTKQNKKEKDSVQIDSKNRNISINKYQ